MTGTKKDREALKNRYRKGMYPTENDFADVFESYVHKDDDIPMSKVVITDGDGKPTTLSGEIDKKADKTTLQTFIDEIETILQVVRNDKNQIASTAIDNLPSRIQAAEDDIDTAEDNISGHETRIATLESSKTDYEAFKERVRAFLEDADASDATINRWHEIETFLQGITDTETLTGLLNDLKNEILAAIPSPQSGNFIEYTTDLDAITDAPNGKIMQYWGQSNDKYKRGQFYERVEGDEEIIPSGTNTIQLEMDGEIYQLFLSNELNDVFSAYNGRVFTLNGSTWELDTNNTYAIKIVYKSDNTRESRKYVLVNVNGVLYRPEIKYCTSWGSTMYEVTEGGGVYWYIPELNILVDADTDKPLLLGFAYGYTFTAPNTTKKVILLCGQRSDADNIDTAASWHAIYLSEDGSSAYADEFVTINGDKGYMGGFGTPKTNEQTIFGSPSTWQHIHVDEVIN